VLKSKDICFKFRTEAPRIDMEAFKAASIPYILFTTRAAEVQLEFSQYGFTPI
jgi:hypothetical protein